MSKRLCLNEHKQTGLLNPHEAARHGLCLHQQPSLAASLPDIRPSTGPLPSRQMPERTVASYFTFLS
jgi:hypothetical protein